MSLKEQINNDIKTAMKAKQKAELLALRSIKSMILLAETEKGSAEELNEDSEIKILTKAAKQRKEALELFQKEGREDLAEKEKLEYDVISKYLPKQLNEEELKVEIASIITELGVSGMQNMGRVMGEASKKLAGKADGKMISVVVKELLAK